MTDEIEASGSASSARRSSSARRTTRYVNTRKKSPSRAASNSKSRSSSRSRSSTSSRATSQTSSTSGSRRTSRSSSRTNSRRTTNSSSRTSRRPIQRSHSTSSKAPTTQTAAISTPESQQLSQHQESVIALGISKEDIDSTAKSLEAYSSDFLANRSRDELAALEDADASTLSSGVLKRKLTFFEGINQVLIERSQNGDQSGEIQTAILGNNRSIEITVRLLKNQQANENSAKQTSGQTASDALFSKVKQEDISKIESELASGNTFDILVLADENSRGAGTLRRYTSEAVFLEKRAESLAIINESTRRLEAGGLSEQDKNLLNIAKNRANSSIREQNARVNEGYAR